MKLSNLKLLAEGKLHLAVSNIAGSNGETFSIIVDISPLEVNNSDLWHKTLTQEIRRQLIRKSGQATIGSTYTLVKECLENPAIQMLLRKDNVMTQFFQNDEEALVQKLQLWGVSEIHEPQENSSPQREPLEAPTENNATRITSKSGKAKKTKSGNSIAVAMILAAAALIAIFYYYNINRQNTEDSDALTAYEKEVKVMRDSMMGFWQDCLVINSSREIKLSDLIAAEDYALLEDDYKLKVEKLIFNHNTGEKAPIGEAIKYLNSRKDIIGSFCQCTIKVDCSY